MKEVIKITGVLTSICIICAFLLSFVYGIAIEKIEINKQKRVEDAIINLAPYAEKIEEIKIDNEVIYNLFNNKGKILGYAFIAEGQGYQGKIKMLSVIDVSLKKLQGIEVVESIETPGLGAKIKDNSFKTQFKNINISKDIECLKDDPKYDNQIKSITGATVSSRAVTNILNKKINVIINLVNKK